MLRVVQLNTGFKRAHQYANLDDAMIGNHVYFDDFTSISIGDYSVLE
jgi:hypothetical protein